MERLVPMLPAGAQVHTPYGATECLPVCSIGSDEILRETRQQTDQGKGVCIGMPVPGLVVKIIRISDEPIEAWEDSLELPLGELGEICVKGMQVTREYYNQPQATALAKIKDATDGGFYHRMGDVGYRDELGRIWFCGRKSQRVITQRGTLYTIPCEAVFNTHPAVFRSALVGVRRASDVQPVICIELEADFPTSNQGQVEEELIAIGARYAHTRPVKTVLFHPNFSVDVRHNSKIFREQLAVWASRKML
jgi:acyl-CoA synthetase (AMP-forming)/AMP-acid ligase II